MGEGPALIAVGGLTLDYVRNDSGLSGPAIGGNALYAAVGAWLVGARPTIAARIGADFPGSALDQLRVHDFDLGCIDRIDGPSFRVLLDESSGARVQSFLPGSGTNRTLDPSPSRLPSVFGSAVHICGISPSVQLAFLEVVRKTALTTTLDTVLIPGQIEPVAPELEHLMDLADVFLPSIDEVSAFWGQPGLETWLRQQRAKGRRVVVKLGSNGSATAEPDGRFFRVPAAAAAVVDATGAGDAYCGAFCVVFAATRQVHLAMRWAAAASSVVIQDYGALHAVTSRNRSLVQERALTLLEDYPVYADAHE